METTTPLMRFFDLLVARGVQLSWLADQAGMTRAAISHLRNGHTARPHPSTQASIEESCKMPEGTIVRVLDGTLSPEEAVALYGTADEPVTPEGTRLQLRMLTGEVERTQDQSAELTRRLESLDAAVQRLRDDRAEFQSHTDDLVREMREHQRELDQRLAVGEQQLEALSGLQNRLEALLQRFEGRQ